MEESELQMSGLENAFFIVEPEVRHSRADLLYHNHNTNQYQQDRVITYTNNVSPLVKKRDERNSSQKKLIVKLKDSLMKFFDTTPEDGPIDGIEMTDLVLELNSASMLQNSGNSDLSNLSAAEYLALTNSSETEFGGMNIAKFLLLLDEAVKSDCSSLDGNKITFAVNTFVEKFLEMIKKMDPLYDFELIKCGSAYEDLRVGKPYEFDYMLKWKNFEAVKVQLNNHAKEGEKMDRMDVKVLCKCWRGDDAYANDPGKIFEQSQILFTNTKRNLVGALRKCINRVNDMKLNDLKIKEISDHYNAPNFKIYCKFKTEGIMIDLVPCLQFPESSYDILPEMLENAIDFIHGLPIENPISRHHMQKRIAKDLYMVCTDIESKWRISTSLLEMSIMKYIPEYLKRKMRLMKFLFQQYLVYSCPYETRQISERDALRLYGFKPFIPSFALKLFFLHGVLNVYAEENGLCQNASYENCVALEDKVTEYMLNNLIRYQRSPLGIKSFLFGDNHTHKFLFGQDLAMLNEHRSPWFTDQLRKIKQVMTGQVDCDRFLREIQLLNYPAYDNAFPFSTETH